LIVELTKVLPKIIWEFYSRFLEKMIRANKNKLFRNFQEKTLLTEKSKMQKILHSKSNPSNSCCRKKGFFKISNQNQADHPWIKEL